MLSAPSGGGGRRADRGDPEPDVGIGEHRPQAGRETGHPLLNDGHFDGSRERAAACGRSTHGHRHMSSGASPDGHGRVLARAHRSHPDQVMIVPSELTRCAHEQRRRIRRLRDHRRPRQGDDAALALPPRAARAPDLQHRRRRGRRLDRRRSARARPRGDRRRRRDPRPGSVRPLRRALVLSRQATSAIRRRSSASPRRSRAPAAPSSTSRSRRSCSARWSRASRAPG